jgi:hypothetical protein
VRVDGCNAVQVAVQQREVGFESSSSEEGGGGGGLDRKALVMKTHCFIFLFCTLFSSLCRSLFLSEY